MIDLSNLVEKWDLEIRTLKRIKLSHQNFYKKTYDNILNLAKFKYDPYQPQRNSGERDFMTRLRNWLEQFIENKQRFLFYLASKIIFFTFEQIENLMETVFERKIKKEILTEIINDNSKSIDYGDFKSALNYFQDELDKTLFCGLSPSARFNEFFHLNKEINRKVSTGFSIDTLLYPFKMKLKLSNANHKDLCEKFEELILDNEELIKNKNRLVVLEDTCCSGSDFINFLNIIRDINVPFKSIYIVPYIITYLGKSNIEKWIKKNNHLPYKIKLLGGSEIPEQLKCFDEKDSYLKMDWKEDIDICEEIKKICLDIYNINFTDNLKEEYKFGINNVKNAVVTYFNCPDTSLPIIWFPNQGKWKTLFLRSSRII